MVPVVIKRSHRGSNCNIKVVKDETEEQGDKLRGSRPTGSELGIETAPQHKQS